MKHRPDGVGFSRGSQNFSRGSQNFSPARKKISTRVIFRGQTGFLYIRIFIVYLQTRYRNFTRYYSLKSMKKQAFFAALVFATLTSQPAAAQINFGMKAGLNINKMDISGNGNLDSDNRAGWFIGPTAEFKIPIVGLGVNGALLFDQRKTKLDDHSTYTENYLAIPVNLKYNFGMSSIAGFFLNGGPQFSCRIGEKNRTWDDYGYDSKTWATSFNVGAGVRLGGHLDLGANYNFTVGKSGSYYNRATGTDRYNTRNNGWQIYIGYVF